MGHPSDTVDWKAAAAVTGWTELWCRTGSIFAMSLISLLSLITR